MLHYASFDEALTLVARYGQKALMTKLDIKDAFRLCPIRLEDREILGIRRAKSTLVFASPLVCDPLPTSSTA